VSPTLSDAGRSAARALASSRGGIAATWAAATFLALAALAGGPGVSRDEAAVIAAAERVPAAAASASPPLAPALAGAGHALGTRLGIGHARAFRLGSALAGALLSALLAAAAWTLAGSAGALLAPALFWLAPRHLQAGLVATPEIALAAAALGAVLAWRRAASAESRGGRLRAAALAGALLGVAVIARADAWVLLPALALHASARALARRASPGPGAGAIEIAVAAALAAAVVAIAWPGALRGGTAPWLPEPRAGGALLPFLTIPVTLACALAGGALHAAIRIARAIGGRAPSSSASDDALFLLAAAAAFAGSGLAHAPAGARPFVHAIPFLAILGARTLLHAAAEAWPSRAAPLAGALALLVLYPGVRAAARAHPHGASAWNEIAGGAAGAASRGLPRQDGAEAVAAVLGAVNARARAGARIWWPGTAPAAVALYARDGRLRADLALAGAPDEADLAIVALDGGPRDAEYRAWSMLRTARPSAGVYVDEVPLALVYARAGAWR